MNRKRSRLVFRFKVREQRAAFIRGHGQTAVDGTQARGGGASATKSDAPRTRTSVPGSFIPLQHQHLHLGLPTRPRLLVPQPRSEAAPRRRDQRRCSAYCHSCHSFVKELLEVCSSVYKLLPGGSRVDLAQQLLWSLRVVWN